LHEQKNRSKGRGDLAVETMLVSYIQTIRQQKPICFWGYARRVNRDYGIYYGVRHPKGHVNSWLL